MNLMLIIALVILVGQKPTEAGEMIKKYYEWNSDYEPYNEQIIPWKGTLLRIQNCKWGASHAWYCFRTLDPYHPSAVNCDVKTLKKSPTFEIFFSTAVSLENGKIVMKLNNWKFLIVDLISCSKIILHFKAPMESDQIIPRLDSFDLNEGSSLALYSDRGEFIRRLVIPQRWFDQVDKFSNSGNTRSFYNLENYKDPCKNDTKENCTYTALRIMDSKYSVMEDHVMEHPVQAFSFSHDSYTFCYYKDDPLKQVRDILQQTSTNTVHCNVRNREFKIEQEVVVGQTTQTLRNRDIAVQNLPGGGSVVLFNGSEDKEEGSIIYRVIGPGGKLGEKGVFMKTEGTLANDFEIYMFEKEERIYCGVMARPDVVFGKCFEVYV